MTFADNNPILKHFDWILRVLRRKYGLSFNFSFYEIHIVDDSASFEALSVNICHGFDLYTSSQNVTFSTHLP